MKAQLKRHNGNPTIFLNDQPIFAGIHLLGSLDPNFHDLNQQILREYAGAGIHIYSIDSVGPEWCGPRPGNESHFDFAATAPRLQEVLDADPNALFLLRMGFETRYLLENWWNKMYPEELDLLSDGQRIAQSFASTVWQRSSSEPTQRYFRAWLRGKYGDDVARLRAAWNSPEVSFETAEVPPAPAQMSTTHFLFRDPRKEQQVVDFYDCYANLCADSLLDLCRLVKTVTNGEKLTGAFFGYLMELSWNDSFFNNNYGDITNAEVSTTQRSGHLGLAKLLRSADIDFLSAPTVKPSADWVATACQCSRPSRCGCTINCTCSKKIR